ncbi:MaoC family dehydratase [Enterovirga rhinocerotis]|uniref:Acyl dehydratase n=1 Tax=Enterovirga rhinocerotis TaxID=1339210 RepID=A0A4R7C042_9HYPH|nr:MaoC/PaaZ C-terminal domain-containing protein [Enterovirga rhinocerotis]TDR90415.1 acyl dehydratase [Enterovirga rhinocerotis]
MGLHVEDFEIGTPILSRGRTIGEGDISLFAGLVGDHNPLHVDEEFCRTETPYGGRIAHGPLTMSVAIGLMSQMNLIDGTAIGLLEVGWTFAAPVKIGDTVRARVTPLLARPTRDPARGVVKLGFDVLNQHDETVQSGFITLMMRTRNGAVPPAA